MVYRRKTFRPKKTVKKTTAAKPANKQKKKNYSVFQNFVKSVYNVITALPFVPTPIKSMAAVVAGQLGVAEITRHQHNPNLWVINDAAPYCVCYYFIIRSNAYILKSGLGTTTAKLSKTAFTTNYRSIRPRVTTITMTPSAKFGTRAGYYSAAIFPFTSSSSAAIYENLNKKFLCDDQWLTRAPIYRRFNTSKTGTLTYRTPKSNTFLHMGVPLQQNGKTTVADGVMAVAINFMCDNRTDYANFQGSEVGVDIKLTCLADPLEYDGLESFEVWNNPIRDVLHGSTSYHSPDKTYWIHDPVLTYDPLRKTMHGETLTMPEVEMDYTE